MISYFIPLWSKNMVYISIFLNLSKLVQWPNIWSILQNVSCTHEKTASVECRAMYVLAACSWFTGLFESFINILSGCSVHYLKGSIEVYNFIVLTTLNFCSKKSRAPLTALHFLQMLDFSQWANPFANIYGPSLSLVTILT